MAFRRIPVTYLAYVFLLMGFASLGAFIAALATRSDLAGVAGVGLIACLGGAVAGFHIGSRQLAQSRQSGDRGNNVSIFSVPLRRHQIDRYHENYPNEKASIPQGPVMAVVAGGTGRQRKASSDSRSRSRIGPRYQRERSPIRLRDDLFVLTPQGYGRRAFTSRITP